MTSPWISERAVVVVVAAGLGTLNHTALTVESLAAHGVPCAGLIIGRWPVDPGTAETFNRTALESIADVRAVLPTGAGSLRPAEFEALSASAFDPGWVANENLMVHSVELLFDPDTEAAVRQIWDGLREAGMPSQAPPAGRTRP